MAQGKRYKEWRVFCQDVSSLRFDDWPIEGPHTSAQLCVHIDRHGRLPSGFLERWARAKKIEETDRVFHELRWFMESLELGGTYDQLNLGACAWAQAAARRAQVIFDAYDANPAKPNFDGSKYLAGTSQVTDAIAPELRSFAARRAKDEAEVEKQRQRARDLRTRGPVAAAYKK